MKKIILGSILLCSILFSDSMKEDSLKDNFKSSGVIKTYYSNINIDKTDGSTQKIQMYYTSAQLNFDYTNDSFHFQATPYVYIYDTTDHKEIKNPVVSDLYSKSKFFFRSLYMSYSYEDFSIGTGILPFSNSVPMKYSDNSIQDGVGLNTLNDNDLLAIFGTYKTSNSSTIFGVGELVDDRVVPTGDYIDESLKEDTLIYFLINTIDNDKWTFTNELMHIDMKYNKKDLSKVWLAGVGASWDDSMDSGVVFYDVLGGSIYDSHASNAKDEIYTEKFGSLAKGNYLESVFPNSFAMKDKTYYGASNLLGLRYEIDALPLETFINIEWFRTFGDWTSGNQGNIYNGKINQMFNNRDNSYYVNYGILTSKNSLLRFTYSYIEFNESGKVGAPASTIKSEDFFGGNTVVRKKVEAIHVIFTYRF